MPDGCDWFGHVLRQRTSCIFTLQGGPSLYPYTESRYVIRVSLHPQVRTTTPQPGWEFTIFPLDVREWIRTLDQHPDRAFAKYITNGLSNGFRIGFARDTRLRTRSNIDIWLRLISTAHDPSCATQWTVQSGIRYRMSTGSDSGLPSTAHCRRLRKTTAWPHRFRYCTVVHNG